MKVLVLGAGVIGTCTAWYLAALGHEVRVVDRQQGAGLETSFANGGQISVSHSEPWANPAAPLKLLKWLRREDSPLLFRLRLDPHQWIWGLRFFYECMPWRTPVNSRLMVTLSSYSRAQLEALRAQTGIQYDALERGILHYFTDRASFDAAAASAPALRRYGLELEMKSPAEAVAIEPALAHFRDRIAGASYTRTDESGDAHLFTANLARLCAGRGVEFLFGRDIAQLRTAGGRIAGVRIEAGGEPESVLTADAYVVALGSYSPLLTRPIGIGLPIYPAKGYSVTADVVDPARTPMVSITDDEAKIVFSRLGRRLRIAGTAELSGYTTYLNPVRCEALIRRAEAVFPGAADYGNAKFWTGLRPSTPSNVPLIGKTRYPNLYLNTGHGTLGWTMACGSGKAVADIISGKKPEVEFRWSS
ncbi:MAG: D-amino acid dehydrogenase [Pseudomonadota bacterium]|nr:D-amino acid dehydrogenase [Pseudomonadota bacterium]